jgi:non-heme chloroperoxidase
MSTIKTKDGTQIYYKDWGRGRPVVFSHGWPLDADAWDAQMLFLGLRGLRVIAYDRRSHGRSDQTWDGNDMDTYADDIAALMDALDLRETALVGHSSGGGDITRYVGRHGTARVAKMVLIDAVPPMLLKTADNPYGAPLEAFDDTRKNVFANRSQFFKDLTLPFYGYNRPGAQISEGVREAFWLHGMLAGFKGVYDNIKAYSETDFTADLKKADVPILVIHGDDDQLVPIRATAMRTVEIAPRATLKVYPGAPHGLPVTHQDRLNSDLLEFIQA